MAQPAKAPPLTRGVKLLYGFGSVAYGANAQLMGLLLLFYNQLMGLPAHWVSLALAISIVFDAFWDPAVGQVSDHLRTPWGRRHPLMYLSAIPFAIAWVMLWNPPGGLSPEQLFVWLLVGVMASRALISLYEVPSSALAPELAPDYHDRTVLLSYRYLFGVLVGGGGGTVLGFFLFLRPTAEQPVGQLNIEGYGPYALTIAAIMVFSIFVSTAGTHHRIKYLHQPPKRQVKAGEMFRQIAVTLSNRNFLVLVASGVFAGMSSGLSGGLQIYFSTYYWGLTADSVGVLALGGLIAAPLATVLATMLSRRFGKKHACISLFFGGLFFSVLPITLRLLDLMPPNGSPLLLPSLALAVITYTALGMAGYILVSSMLADVVEETQLKTGQRSEGLLMSADNLLQKVIAGLATILPGLILTMIAFPDRAQPGAVDESVLRNLALSYVPAVALFSTIAISCLMLYRIDREAHERNLATLREAAALAEGAMESDPAQADAGGPGLRRPV